METGLTRFPVAERGDQRKLEGIIGLRDVGLRDLRPADSMADTRRPRTRAIVAINLSNPAAKAV